MRSDAWKSDPLVKVQDGIWPVMWTGGRVVINHHLGQPAPPNWEEAFGNATSMLRQTGIELMLAFGVPISDADRDIFVHAADQVAACRDVLRQISTMPATKDTATALLARIQHDMQPAVVAAIDRFRMVFINLIIAREAAYANQTGLAISGLDKISKQIFFISINASVEAARAGDAGRGFSQISTEIRALSQSAQNATRDLSDLVAKSNGSA